MWRTLIDWAGLGPLPDLPVLVSVSSLGLALEPAAPLFLGPMADEGCGRDEGRLVGGVDDLMLRSGMEEVLCMKYMRL